jgi:Ca-activated chloride channel family protein
VECSLRHKVLSRFTAFVAVDRSEIVNAGGERKQIIQPVDAPDGWDMIGDVVESAEFSPVRCAGLALRAMPTAGRPRSSDAVSDFAPLFSPEFQAERSFAPDRSTPPPSSSLQRKQIPVRFDLPALRARALQLLEKFRKMLTGSNARRVLAMLQEHLDVLIRDVALSGAPLNESWSLRQLLGTLHQQLRAGIDEQQAQALWREAEIILDAFAQGAATPDAGDRLASAETPPRKEFWK